MPYLCCQGAGKAALLLLAALLAACSSSSGPAPVTTLELRENFYQQRNRGTLASRTYVVQRGDTLYAIAFRAGKDVRELAALNGIASPYTIFPGQTLRLTGKVKAKPAVTAGSTKTVQNKPASTATKNTNKNNSSPAKSNSSAKAVKPVAPQNQKGYVQIQPKNNKKTANPTLNGDLVQWQWPAKGKIISAFSSQQHGNKGIDIAGQEGGKVVAAASGQVVYAGNALRGYGNLIIIKHNDDYLSAYAHNRKLLVKEKQMVTAGQQIAELGSTDATDARLHFEIRFRGSSVNPLKYLPK
ncbi:MAG: peptidoglycan DD-metalloendopeptidase family protein [Gammaproteobacteria bacterium]|nr:peptidoglycan DD-metalloendopeptidase family protein [Gammaproteobacteria bacterium]MBU1555749.1 peptidoglycan DD-metalloendopeptidase family protein [Gammaproteobacteria bacterium]MBU2071924.1 peptidoglycan DD-metalloendopeptidase family protein [Gammaproteobacteria bacterium]MBU2181785.1 peptidoglycan DD-metalloendopeptidase family protein [Gammaproteobacteria bacterium]MBU2206373.1 peptidoglycan DD-metalloendopeptidase family protein [Gammaproteobacteria bacterium]